MKKILLCLALSAIALNISATPLEEKLAALPVFDELASNKTPFDWLITPEKSQAAVYASADRKSIIVANAMLWRTFRILPNLATTDLVNRMTGERMVRAVSPEGSVTINDSCYDIGGLSGQKERGYLQEEWIETMAPTANSFQIVDIEIGKPAELVKWKPTRWALNSESPTGCEVVFVLRGPAELGRVTVRLHVALYDHLPVIRKHFEVINETDDTLCIDRFQLERLAFFEPESPVGSPGRFMLPNIHVESDYHAGGTFTERETDITERWLTDPDYTSQRNYSLQTPCILEVAPPLGPAEELAPGAVFSSFNVFEMPFDSDERERKGLFTRHFYSSLAPWTTQNPIFLHLTSTNPETVRRAVDQCAETGYEMIIISFGSGLNMEDISEENIGKYKALVDYAHSKGIEMGCYSLLASRWISDEVDVINPKTGKRGGMCFGSSPCLCSEWGQEYFRKLKTFLERTGMTCLEHDGSYPGDPCASTSHLYHRGLQDSQWKQFRQITDFYHWLSERGIYSNVPDFYFLNGTTKVGIGYREVNWSLPRERQLIHARQLNYDCTWERPASALWSFVPLVQYHGGGDAATLEPLSEHLYEYRTHMVQNYGAGVQACYRGPRLYDTDETRQMVTDVISWYKKYRRILNSDIIHLRKPDARDWDGMMHVNPREKEKALAMLYNPLPEDITRQVTLPLYYTGLERKARIREKEGKPRTYKLAADHSVTLTVTIPARSYTWFVVE
ncbi:MAG: alpha-galactosidase [Bacteroidaceae bacterium]|nr:alpha-galactosidase [Bacteroidaceae bacterium]